MTNCPNCKRKLDAVTGVDHEEQPQPNDVSVCFYCGAINQFNDELELVPLPEEVLEYIKENETQNYDIIMEVVSRIKSRKE